ncbi:threonine aldolase family protein [Rhizobium sp. LARHSG275]|uniref:threonine aldolase family protein n=1 Tax=Rhizobium TaxID=379 RepID=UPI00138A55D7|nr:low specificity L-threonine aldolase [Rhizobium laguerreae]NDK52354.1 low specificity L-threonine aldolase [Rhizobium laguerreae]
MMNVKAPSIQPPARGFTSDNIAGISPEMMEAIVRCNAGQAAPYGNDEVTQRLEVRMSNIFEKDVKVFLVSTGSAANALCLATMTPPWGSVLSHADAHINRDECGAPEFFCDGAKLVQLGGENAKIDLAALQAQSKRMVGDVHSVQPSCVSITQATEVGSVYSLDEIEAIGAVCRDAGLGLHMDGARFANGLVTLGCSPAEMTWKRGVDALSFGATKNGTFGVDAIVLFNQDLAQPLAFRRKRAGQLGSKMRFFSAQMEAYLADDLWLSNARHANAMAKALAAGLASISGAKVDRDPEANILFCKLADHLINGLLSAGFRFYHDRWEAGTVRFVTSFATTQADVDDLLAAANDLAQLAVRRSS